MNKDAMSSLITSITSLIAEIILSQCGLIFLNIILDFSRLKLKEILCRHQY